MKTELALLMLYEKPVLSREQLAELMGVKRETMSNMSSAESVPIPMFKVEPR
jgi:DNA-binding XRE family transcriptional regulator